MYHSPLEDTTVRPILRRKKGYEVPPSKRRRIRKTVGESKRVTADLPSISRWFDEGRKKSAHYMFVVCDTFTITDYPVYCRSYKHAHEWFRDNHKTDQRIMECFNLKKCKDTQLSADKMWALHGTEP